MNATFCSILSSKIKLLFKSSLKKFIEQPDEYISTKALSDGLHTVVYFADKSHTDKLPSAYRNERWGSSNLRIVDIF